MAQQGNRNGRKNPAGGIKPATPNSANKPVSRPAVATETKSTPPPPAAPKIPVGNEQTIPPRRLTPKQEAMRRRQQRRRRTQILVVGALTAVIVVAAIIIGFAVTTPTSLYDVPTKANLDSSFATLGSADAKVTLIEYGDLRCTGCKQYFDDAEKTIRDKYVTTSKVKYQFRNYTVIDTNLGDGVSAKLGQAAFCAADQKRFWDFHDVMYSNYGTKDFPFERVGYPSDKFIKDVAKAIALNMDQFNSCYDTSKYKQQVADQVKEARDKGVTSTPTFYVKVGDGAEEKVEFGQTDTNFVTPISTKLDEALKKAGVNP